LSLIDILLPVRNGIDFLAESLDSVCKQTVSDWRLIVLDHGSTDGSRELAMRYQELDSRVEVHSFPDADGLSELLNRGIELCDCEYMIRHDADDICYPDRISVSLNAFKVNPSCIVIGGQADVINSIGKNIGKMNMPIGTSRVAAASLFRNPIAHPTAMFKFSEVSKLGARYGTDFLKAMSDVNSIEVKALAEDYLLFGQFAILGKCTNVPNKLIRYRWHGNNVSSTKFDEQMAVSLKVSRFLAESLCTMHGVSPFDPAPFCNLGGQLIDVDGQKNFDMQYQVMAESLRRVFGKSEDLERELRYRYVVSSRQLAQLLWRYNQFRVSDIAETGEWNAVRSWLLRWIPGKRGMSTSSKVFF
jgi:glycosyltransferase involved in cell wall biosynthesis